jgi:hypothetical protein
MAGQVTQTKGAILLRMGKASSLASETNIAQGRISQPVRRYGKSGTQELKKFPPQKIQNGADHQFPSLVKKMSALNKYMLLNVPHC